MTTAFDIIRPSAPSGAPPQPPLAFDPTRLPRGERRRPYVLSAELATTINVALALDQPLLVTGEPGCGKTALAGAVAAQLDCEVLEFHTKSTSTARDVLYHVDSPRRFYDANRRHDRDEDVTRYITFGALGDAIMADTAKVVLIDEIDKAPRDFPNDLLDEIEKMWFTIAETGKKHTARVKHFVLITSNGDRRLPTPFLRRCVYANIAFPDAEMLARIVELHCDLPSRSFVELVVDRFLELRNHHVLVKPPATSELIAWTHVLQRMGIPERRLRELPVEQLPAMETLIKIVDDLRTVRPGTSHASASAR